MEVKEADVSNEHTYATAMTLPITSEWMIPSETEVSPASDDAQAVMETGIGQSHTSSLVKTSTTKRHPRTKKFMKGRKPKKVPAKNNKRGRKRAHSPDVVVVRGVQEVETSTAENSETCSLSEFGERMEIDNGERHTSLFGDKTTAPGLVDNGEETESDKNVELEETNETNMDTDLQSSQSNQNVENSVQSEGVLVRSENPEMANHLLGSVCDFCDCESHQSLDCQEFKNVRDRQRQLKLKKVCTKCLGRHQNRSCGAPPPECVYCGKCHNSVLCRRKLGSLNRKWKKLQLSSAVSTDPVQEIETESAENTEPIQIPDDREEMEVDDEESQAPVDGIVSLTDQAPIVEPTVTKELHNNMEPGVPRQTAYFTDSPTLDQQTAQKKFEASSSSSPLTNYDLMNAYRRVLFSMGKLALMKSEKIAMFNQFLATACHFCDARDHLSLDCKMFPTIRTRQNQLKLKNLCTKCLENHKNKNCDTPIAKCVYCGKNHNAALCKKQLDVVSRQWKKSNPTNNVFSVGATDQGMETVTNTIALNSSDLGESIGNDDDKSEHVLLSNGSEGANQDLAVQNLREIGSAENVQPQEETFCLLCDSLDHDHEDCDVFKYVKDRRKQLRRKSKCTKCLGNHGMHSCPNPPPRCMYCEKEHNSVLCRQKFDVLR